MSGALQDRLDRLADWLGPVLGAQAVTLGDATRMAGGAIQENWAATMTVTGGAQAGCHAVVLRCDAPSSLSFSHDRAQEFALLRHAFAAGARTPRPLAYCADATVFGRAVVVMSRVAGTASAHRLVKATSDAEGEALVHDIGAALAVLHGGGAYPDLPQPDPVARRVAEFTSFLDAHPSPEPVLRYAVRWMAEHAPETRRDVPCHFDYRSGNIMIENGKVSGILDWEFAANGDPHEDLGWFCAPCWRFGRPDRPAGGLGSRAAFYAGYESVSGLAVNDAAVRYWETVATLRWSIIALAQTARFTSGAERTLELGLTGLMLPDLQTQLLNQIKEANT